MRIPSSQSVYFFLVSSSVTVVATWKILKWRARKRARITSERVERLVQEGPLVDFQDLDICQKILGNAIRRASTWMSYRAGDAAPMVGQVGGVSALKRPVLTLEPDYVLKPLHTDHRGIREISFYEALKIVQKRDASSTRQVYSAWLSKTKSREVDFFRRFGDWCDTIAIFFAMTLGDDVVANYEKSMNRWWKAMKKEIESLRRVSVFTSSYYGVIGQRSPTSSPAANADGSNYFSPYGISLDAHLLLQDVTANFKKPCVIDVKMGTQCWEPDAPEQKRLREQAKYASQETFGFRIVGMRIYDPSNANADEFGFRQFHKEYGRGLHTVEDLMEAFRIFFSTGRVNGDSEPRLRTRSISNLVSDLRPIRGFFEENKTLKFYSSSLLIAYEGDVSAPNPDVSIIKMIDFSRVRRERGGDHGYRHGLKTLSTIFDRLVEEETERMQSK